MPQLRAHEFQNELLVKVLTDASEGRPGSAIYMARDKESSGRPSVHYLKVTPLTGEGELSPALPSSSSSSSVQQSLALVTHLLVELVDLPLTDSETATLLSNRVDESLSSHMNKRQAVSRPSEATTFSGTSSSLATHGDSQRSRPSHQQILTATHQQSSLQQQHGSTGGTTRSRRST